MSKIVVKSHLQIPHPIKAVGYIPFRNAVQAVQSNSFNVYGMDGERLDGIKYVDVLATHPPRFSGLLSCSLTSLR